MGQGYDPIRHVYLRNDIRNILLAVAVAAAGGSRGPEYNAGFADALTAMAVGLGLGAPVQGATPAQGGGHDGRD